MIKDRYISGEKVLYKVRLLAYPSVVLNDLGDQVEIAISPEGNTADESLYKSWENKIVGKNSLKRYTW
jgi:hypothetical protein